MNKFQTYRYERNINDNHRGEAITYNIHVNHTNNTMKFSYSICNYADNFSYAVGRNIAKQRFDSGDYFVGVYDTSITLKKNCEHIVNISNKKFGNINTKLLLNTMEKIKRS